MPSLHKCACHIKETVLRTSSMSLLLGASTSERTTICPTTTAIAADHPSSLGKHGALIWTPNISFLSIFNSFPASLGRRWLVEDGCTASGSCRREGKSSIEYGTMLLEVEERQEERRAVLRERNTILSNLVLRYVCKLWDVLRYCFYSRQ